MFYPIELLAIKITIKNTKIQKCTLIGLEIGQFETSKLKT